MDGIGNSPAPTKQLGAFDAPKPATVGPAAAGQSPAKPQTDHLTVDLGTGKTIPIDKPIDIPKVPMQQPVTALKASGSNAKGATGKAVITYVADGDTAYAGDVKCRIDGIDAPEVAKPKYNKPGQAYGEESKRTLQDLIDRKEVTIRITKPTIGGSNYGRDMCQIEIEGKDVTTEMLRSGAAELYRRYNNDPRLQAVEAEAKSAKRGMWSIEGTGNSEQFRHMNNYGRRN